MDNTYTVEEDGADGSTLIEWTVDARYHIGRPSRDRWQPDDGDEFEVDGVRRVVTDEAGAVLSDEQVRCVDLPDHIERRVATLAKCRAELQADERDGDE